MIAFTVWLSLCAGAFSLIYLADGIVYNRRRDQLHFMRFITLWLLSFFSVAALIMWLAVAADRLIDMGIFG
ncbi:hypothetical protein XAP3_0074 [Xanthomonas phage XAP3]|nr:hypothetical protein XAP3_0074 [Xanthomonas phage XAP3]